MAALRFMRVSGLRLNFARVKLSEQLELGAERGDKVDDSPRLCNLAAGREQVLEQLHKLSFGFATRKEQRTTL